ncbi:NADPH:quinone oxidoreductase family protein [Yaniella flava]|uniref:NADPH:quinone oxidoreductase family protein n=1 Tax=Yaniella flava TaxID=287930 RepID=A0ABP5FU67_9MICC
MRALTVREFGKPESIELLELPNPTPKSDEVLIDVQASSINYPDLMVIDGTYQALPKLPFTPGIEVAGRVAAVGNRSSKFRIDDRVLALVPHGGHAEKVIATEHQIYALPDEVTYIDAAAFSVVYATAWIGLMHRAGLRASDTVLITGAGGGVGSAGVDLANAYGANTVIALARDNDRADLARSLGAHHVLTSTPSTLRDDIMHITDGQGVDITLESVGGDVLKQVIRATGWEGNIVITGFASGSQPEIKPGHILVKNISVHGFQLTDYRDRRPQLLGRAFHEMLPMVSNKTLVPPIANIHSLEDSIAAFNRFRAGGLRGKVIISMVD